MSAALPNGSERGLHTNRTPQELAALLGPESNSEAQETAPLSTELQSVSGCAREMASRICAASIAGATISQQVSALDCAQSRVSSVLSRVSLMLELKEIIKRVEE